MGRCVELYDRVKQLEGDWLGQEIQKRITSSITSSLVLAQEPVDVQDQSNERRAAGEKFLSVLRGAWEDHQLCMGMITDVLMYMVGYHVFGHIPPFARLTCILSMTIGSSHYNRTPEAIYLRCSNGHIPRLCATVERPLRFRYQCWRCAQIHRAFYDSAGKGRTRYRTTVDTTLHLHA